MGYDPRARREELGEVLVPHIAVEGDERLFSGVLDELDRSGWRLHEGWDLHGSHVNPRDHVACVGRIATQEDAERALVAGLRGHRLVVHIASADVAAAFLDDLRRIGPLEIMTAHDGPAKLDDDQARLLRLLADGNTIAEASRTLHVSLRTANRRLAAARTAVGAESTAAAVSLAKARGWC